MTETHLNEHNIKLNPTMTTTDIRAAIYARVSSTGDRQSTERQVIDLTDYASRNSMTICQTFEEHISAPADLQDYLAHINHPSEAGHRLVAEAIAKYFL